MNAERRCPDSRALLKELAHRGIRAIAQASFAIDYKGRHIGEYDSDILVKAVLVVELKCVERLANEHTAQCLNYRLRPRKAEGAYRETIMAEGCIYFIYTHNCPIEPKRLSDRPRAVPRFFVPHPHLPRRARFVSASRRRRCRAALSSLPEHRSILRQHPSTSD